MTYIPRKFSSGQEMARQRALERAEREKQASEASWANLPSVDMAQQDFAARIQNELMQSQRDPRYQLGLLAPAAAPADAPAEAPAAPQPKTPYPDLGQASVNAGMQAGQQREQLGLFGNMISNIFDNPTIGRAVDRLLEYSMRPEAQPTGPGDTFISQLARGAYGTRQSELAAIAQRQAVADKIKLEEAKAGAKAAQAGQIKPTYSDLTKLRDSANSYKTSIEALSQLRELAQRGNPTGGIASLKTTLTEAATAFGIPTDLTDQQKADQLRSIIITKINEARVYGAQVSQADYKNIFNYLSPTGVTVSREKFLNSLNNVMRIMGQSREGILNEVSRLEKQYPGITGMVGGTSAPTGMNLTRQTVTR